MIEVCGTNEFFQLGEASNTKNNDDDPSISPPIKLNIDPTDILSYSIFNEHAVMITKEGIAQAIGNNEDGKVGGTLPKETLQQFTKFEIKDEQGHLYTPISSVCGYLYTLYLVTLPESGDYHLVYFYSDMGTPKPLFLKIGELMPISLFGGYENSAAIDQNGSIIFIPDYDTFPELFEKKFEATFLPENEKAVKVACCDDFVIALSSSGHVFYSDLPEDGNKLNFTKVTEFEGKEITEISGTCLHALALSADGTVFAFGQNNCGQLGLGSEKVEALNFTKVEALVDYKISMVYAGGVHSLFQTDNGKVLACGGNNYLQIPIRDESHKKNFYEIVETTINEGASFCIAGDSMSAIFINCNPPKSPNKKNS